MKSLSNKLKRTLIENFGTDCIMEVYEDRILISDFITITEKYGLYNLYIDRELSIKEKSTGEINRVIRNLIDEEILVY